MIKAIDWTVAGRLEERYAMRQPPTYLATEVERGVVYERGMKVTALRCFPIRSVLLRLSHRHERPDRSFYPGTPPIPKRSFGMPGC